MAVTEPIFKVPRLSTSPSLAEAVGCLCRMIGHDWGGARGEEQVGNIACSHIIGDTVDERRGFSYPLWIISECPG